MQFNRRKLILGAAASAAIAFAPFAEAASPDVDVAKLNEEPTLGDMALGPADAKVTIIEYASLSCSHCADFYKTTFQELKKDYIDTGKVRFIMRDFPHNNAGAAAAMIARCAPKDKFFPLVHGFMTTQESWLKRPLDGLFKTAGLAGLTRGPVEACIKDQKIAHGIAEIRNKAKTEFGVKGVPAFFVNGTMLKGKADMAKFKAMIDPLLATDGAAVSP